MGWRKKEKYRSHKHSAGVKRVSEVKREKADRISGLGKINRMNPSWLASRKGLAALQFVGLNIGGDFCVLKQDRDLQGGV